MNTDKERLDFWNANSLIEFGYSAKMGGDGAGWYWQLGTNRRSGIKNVRDTLDSAMAQLKKPKQVAQDVAQTPSMRHNPTPRTDAATYPADCLGKTLVVHRDCAAALEIELKEAEQEDNAANHYLSRAESAEAELASKTACYDIACGEVQRLRADAEKAEAEANIMREALKVIADFHYRGNPSRESQIAFRALEASK